MDISPDTIILLEWRGIALNATVVFSWLVMAILICISWLATRKLSTDTKPRRWQSFMEAVVQFIRDQVRDVMRQNPDPYMPFLGSLLLYISLSNFLSMVPGYHPPTGSIHTTAALALCVFFAVPVFGILKQGLGGYLKHYIQPTPIMLPFNVIGELSRTLALAVRLFGNVMSGTLIAAILIGVIPLFLPALMQLLDLLVGQIQAYIFTVLSMVYIASATQTQHSETSDEEAEEGKEA